MKKRFRIAILFSGLILTLISFIFSSCFSSSKIVVQNDIVYSTKRIELRYLCRDNDRRSPLLYLEQLIVKEIKSDNEESIKIYDILALTSSSFKLEDKVFLIIDSDVYPMIIDIIEYENAKSITPNTENILAADSTTVSVVTGYSENNKKITRFSYKLSEEIINKIKNSDQVLFRYYAGPSMLTVKLKDKYLRKFKKLIDKV
jgi:hypothetical protein